MEDEILKALTNRELKKTILDKAKNIISQRKKDITEKKKNIVTNEEDIITPLALCDKEENVGNTNVAFFNLQDFCLKYSNTCKINDLNYENIEYELIISFISTFNNELKYQLKSHNMNKKEHKEVDDMIHNMVKIFMDKLIYYCTNPIIFLMQRNDSNSLFDKEIKNHINIFIKQVEQHSDTNILIKNCMNELLGKIFYFIPDRKILFLQKEYKYICIIYSSDLIEKNYENLDFFQVDNVTVLIEIIQYAIIFLVEKKYEVKSFPLGNEEWFEHFKRLLISLKNCKWKIFLNQLIVMETFLYDKKREHLKKSFNELYKHQIELSSIKGNAYSKWFKIEMPLSVSLFK
ncbi:hypothetical protein PFMALIP_04405 [Plasmodium falciparum MaliPS096_E11]|uniref:Uncharacterized protein n=3 Tax=Plasmodium falciparum TaxID=5833 RepID=A0A024X2C6_PLAFC|nr:hypothetical protein PFFVO_04151 [Plasmodium falciparum Vietnam Oak-Knoll (FVO)]ETW47543.1 hypothetical protein PFMALIP_04405 [Plasmodium falciparum MaliPS096_E11]ETW59702.1 hypothetical protein PFMC_04511 [Plasmodium falciparum CAMP/Malaysia]